MRKIKCPTHSELWDETELPTALLELKRGMKELSLGLHSMRGSLSMMARVAIVSYQHDFCAKKFLSDLGWESSGKKMCHYTEDFSPVLKLSSFPCANSAAASGNAEFDNTSKKRTANSDSPASKFTYTQRKKSQKDWLESNRLRWKLVEEETAISLPHQIEIGAYFPSTGFSNNAKACHQAEPPADVPNLKTPELREVDKLADLMWDGREEEDPSDDEFLDNLDK